MIQMPRRSITRFFIPLVDVMLLMFSIFLLMPILQVGTLTTADLTQMTRQELLDVNRTLQEQLTDYFEVQKKLNELEKEAVKLRKENQRLQRFEKLHTEVENLRADIQKLRQEKVEILSKRLFIRVLEIDPKDGSLIYYEPGDLGKAPQAVTIDTGEEARKLVREDRLRPEAQDRELYYLFLFPRVDSAFPEERQFRLYKNWFKDVASGTDMSSKVP